MGKAVNDVSAPDAPWIAGLPHLDSRRWATLARALDLTSASDLELACREGDLRRFEGLDADAERAVLSALTQGRGWGPRRLGDAARAVASRVLDRLQRSAWALRLAPAGAVRRAASVCRQVEIVTTAHDPGALVASFAELSLVRSVSERGPRHVVAAVEGGMEVRLEVAVDDAAWPALLTLRTGSTTLRAR